MVHVFLAESPLQILSAFEARLAHRCPSAPLLLRLNGRSSDGMLLRTAEMLGWRRPLVIRRWWFGSLGFHLIVTALLMRLGGGAKGRLACIHIGDWRSWWMHVTQCLARVPRAIFLDDGSGTLGVQAEYLAKGIHRPPRWRSARGSLFDRIVRRGLARLDHRRGEKPPTLFTAFSLESLPGQTVIRHRWPGVRALMSRRLVDSTMVLYFGSKYSEIGILSREEELRHLGFAHGYYRRVGITMVYVPHRGDSPAKLAAIEAVLGIPIETTLVPAELHLCLRPVMPGHIAAAYSTVLATLPTIASFQSVTAFRLDPSCIASRYTEAIARVYDEYRRAGVTIVDMPARTIPD